MDAMRVNDVLWDIEPAELPGAHRLLAAMEKAVWVSPREASEWRGRIAALGIYHEDPRLWFDGPKVWRIRERAPGRRTRPDDEGQPTLGRIPSPTGSAQLGSLFRGLLTRGETGMATRRSSGAGLSRSVAAAASVSERSSH
jgi:hypothetical protein